MLSQIFSINCEFVLYQGSVWIENTARFPIPATRISNATNMVFTADYSSIDILFCLRPLMSDSGEEKKTHIPTKQGGVFFSRIGVARAIELMANGKPVPG